ncbi:hypothetical protein [Sinorhizobium meliloti]|uniref:hypothetical protein n=1 Tax=Rhizobium meliloti TaxID=382 RepID=UPI00056EAB99|nr:hypothetical protein [Sinorhizobium meliloti]
MSENRYNLRQEDDGTWTVFEIFTGLPAEVNDVEQVGLEMEQADDLVDLLNLLYTSRGDVGRCIKPYLATHLPPRPDSGLSQSLANARLWIVGQRHFVVAITSFYP